MKEKSMNKNKGRFNMNDSYVCSSSNLWLNKTNHKVSAIVDYFLYIRSYILH